MVMYLPEGRSVLVVGGAGYIGSHMIHLLRDLNIRHVVLDDLSSGHREALQGSRLIEGNCGDATLLRNVFAEHDIDAVIHFASFIEVGASVRNPAAYYENNVCNTVTLLSEMVRADVKKFIFSSTAAVYGLPETSKIDESHRKGPINPYGRTKLMVEEILGDFEKAYGLRSVCLRYFNAAGAHPDGAIGENHNPETHLIPLAIAAAITREKVLKVFGDDYDTRDGTCVRDYIHVCDLADAHLLALKYLNQNEASLAANLGNEAGFTVLEVIDAVSRLAGQVPYEVAARRDGDPAVLVADATRAREVLGWTPQYTDVNDIVSHALQWYRKIAA